MTNFPSLARIYFFCNDFFFIRYITALKLLLQLLLELSLLQVYQSSGMLTSTELFTAYGLIHIAHSVHERHVHPKSETQFAIKTKFISLQNNRSCESAGNENKNVGNVRRFYLILSRGSWKKQFQRHIIPYSARNNLREDLPTSRPVCKSVQSGQILYNWLLNVQHFHCDIPENDNGPVQI